ncbi:TRAP transporter small permease [Oscillibacter sp.]|uniref:TRAP transporter small permease n=1 Tax=Oscillibacter sp. TaxID=1945593 RepID=UPI002609D9C1|nr:TRAP transporter small permease [Oscillibacter sp.]MDD3347168.1 TRAP transporter small permease [Oscillibacter sp.]
MKKIMKFLSDFESIICVICFIVMACGCFFQVVNRNIFKIPLSWTEELSRFAMVWMALLGSEIGLRQGKQMSVDAVVNHLPFMPKKIVECFGCLISAAFAGVSGFYAIQFVITTYRNGQLSSAMDWPMWAVYLILPLSLLLMAAYEVWELVHTLLRKRESGDAKDEGGSL